MSFRHVTSNRSRLRAAFGAIVIGFASLLPGCGGQTYSCGGPASDHCYGIVTWKGKPTGFAMEMTAVALNGGDIFIDDEGWLVQHFPKTDPPSAHWVEVGENNEGVSTIYFFAEDSTAGGFMFFDLGPVAQSDIDAATWIAYTVAQNATPTIWDVTVSNASTGIVMFKTQSNDNDMKPESVEEGLEVAGTQNARASIALFSQNSVIQNGTTSLRTTNGLVEADHPPNAAWLGTATPSQTSNGGIFLTDCC
jgi:hypothetical protein